MGSLLSDTVCSCHGPGATQLSKKFTNSKHWTVEQEQIGILPSISVAMRMLLNLDFQLRIKSYPSMIIILAGSLLGYLFFSLYTSDLTAKMTANPPPLPIR